MQAGKQHELRLTQQSTQRRSSNDLKSVWSSKRQFYSMAPAGFSSIYSDSNRKCGCIWSMWARRQNLMHRSRFDGHLRLSVMNRPESFLRRPARTKLFSTSVFMRPRMDSRVAGDLNSSEEWLMIHTRHTLSPDRHTCRKPSETRQVLIFYLLWFSFSL